ncbi:MAG: lyase family protein, partial [Bacteroidota bacterium]
MNLTSLNTISPVDGRYRNKCAELANYFSERALIHFRVKVEIEYFIALCKLPLPQLEKFNKRNFKELKKIYLDFDEDDAIQVKGIEKITNHDVKAVEYFIKIKMNELNLDEFKEFIHFGLTSQDINNTAIPISIKNFLNKIYLPQTNDLLNRLKQLVNDWNDIPMLAHTHGQPASPTRLGKEVAVFYDRIQQQLKQLKSIPHSAKFGGATGNFN